jgi:hypothetical protein
MFADFTDCLSKNPAYIIPALQRLARLTEKGLGLRKHIDDFQPNLMPPSRRGQRLLIRGIESVESIAAIAARLLETDNDIACHHSVRRPFVVTTRHA